MTHPKPTTTQPKAQPLLGQTILITGASRGIGLEAALALGTAGAQIALLARNELALAQIYDRIQTQGGPEPLMVPLDLSQASALNYEELRDQLQQHCGQLHGLIHADALLGTLTPVINYNPNLWQQVMRVNAEALMYLCHYLSPLLMAAPQARVIGFTDQFAPDPAYWGAYAISKAAVANLLQLWQAELTHTAPITCHLLYPGPRCTALRQQAYPAENPQKISTPKALGQAWIELFSNPKPQPLTLDWSS